MRKKHWSAFLPEVGRITQTKGEEILLIQNSITKLKNEIEKLERESYNLEQELLQEVKNDWTTKEITQAREKAIDFNNK